MSETEEEKQRMEKGGHNSPAWGPSKTVAQKGKEQCSHLAPELGTRGSDAWMKVCS